MHNPQSIFYDALSLIVIVVPDREAANALRGLFAGPWMTFPPASNFEPWHWHVITLFWGRGTSHPKCVHFEEKAATSVSDILLTIIGFLASWGFGIFMAPPAFVSAAYSCLVKSRVMGCIGSGALPLDALASKPNTCEVKAAKRAVFPASTINLRLVTFVFSMIPPFLTIKYQLPCHGRFLTRFIQSM